MCPAGRERWQCSFHGIALLESLSVLFPSSCTGGADPPFPAELSQLAGSRELGWDVGQQADIAF